MEKMIFVNQKMYLNSISEIEKFQNEVADFKDKFAVFPSSIYIKDYINNGFITGSQNISAEEEGAYTGDISGKALKDLGAKYVMIGHHEMRKRYKEEKNLIQNKIDRALQNNLKVVLCIGETIEEKVSGKTKEIIRRELENLNINENVIVSYEPVWAIGTNITPTNEEIEDTANYIKNIKNVKVLYGGSVSKDNIEILNKITNLDGFLLGSSALKSSSLKKIIEVVSK